jgi:hypothetical protein
MSLENHRVKAYMLHDWLNSARYKWARTFGFGKGQGPLWPFGTHVGDSGPWNAMVCAFANHTRPTRGTSREMGLYITKSEELGQDLSKNPGRIASLGELSSTGVVWRFGSLLPEYHGKRLNHKNSICGVLTHKCMRSTRIEKARPPVPISKSIEHI